MMWSATSPAVQPSHGESASQAVFASASSIARVSPAAAVRSRSTMSAIAFPPCARQLLVDAPQPARELLEHGSSDGGGVLQQVIEAGLSDRVCVDLVHGDDGCRALLAIEDRHLANDVARSDNSDTLTVDEHLGGAGRDHEALVSHPALAAHDLAGLEGDI